MSTHCQNHNCQCALAGQLADDLKQTLKDMKDCVDSIDKHVTYWIGNTEPGYLPTEFKEIKATVSEHETYIQRQQGANSTKSGIGKAVTALVVPILASCIGAGTALYIYVHTVAK